MKKIIALLLMGSFLSMSAFHEGIKGGYHFTHKGKSCYFLPVNGLPAKIGPATKPNGIALCLETFPAGVSRTKAPATGEDSFSVKYSTASKKGVQAHYKIKI